MLPTLLSLTAAAESWCAAPLTVHEWGVQVFAAGRRSPTGVPLPGWFHTTISGPMIAGTPVAELPADSGIRTLPVLQFYAPKVWGDSIPVALDVGFAQGTPAIWYPQADAATGTDLFWRRLDLSHERPALAVLTDDVGWIDPLRGVEDALWVQRGGEAERFVFYEGTTTESPALHLTPGPSPDLAHHTLRNTADFDVHDVFVVRAQDGQRSVHYAPKIPAGRSVDFLLQPDDTDPAALLSQRLATVRPEGWSMMGEECRMMRSPAEPVSQTTGHRLYADELAVLMEVWEERFFDAEGTRILYREDAAALDALVPLSVYTDMYHYVELSRLGLVLVEGL